jgi:hypothetical protein
MQILATVVRGALAAAVSLVFVGVSQANPVPIEEAAGVVQMTGTVEAIDVPSRLLAVVAPGGNTAVVLVSPDVKHLEKIKLKDTVTISFTEEVAVALRKSDAPQEGELEQGETAGMGLNAPTVAEQDWVETTPAGSSDLTTIEVTDTVAAVNRNKRTITFAGTGGKTRTIKIDPSVQGFDQIEPGDMVVLEVTRAVASDVKLQ